MADLKLIENPIDVDWAALHAFVHRTYAYMDARIDPPSSLHKMDSTSFEEKAKSETLIIARLEAELVGCLFCRPQDDWLYVGKVAVDGAHQGRGIGRALFVRAFDLAARMDLLGLELETRVELIENHRTFEKLGFQKIGENAHSGYDRPTSIRMRAVIETRGPDPVYGSVT